MLLVSLDSASTSLLNSAVSYCKQPPSLVPIKDIVLTPLLTSTYQGFIWGKYFEGETGAMARLVGYLSGPGGGCEEEDVPPPVWSVKATLYPSSLKPPKQHFRTHDHQTSGKQ